ncbi:hypothetical protein [Kingella sp. (in: b-proteobacteria)]|uniref:hypothetical protein n=1 Tax=Kingella sp. (in: b-proteobacteria) TaxID=2020713 RepID=UPI0026DAA089|nr:hypothetical protein [Kingella sp. (in: b-proteobacteria)]MDO4657148.1 hypothetical protein [Kingella sp. (in: b-proteobacteria)]
MQTQTPLSAYKQAVLDQMRAPMPYIELYTLVRIILNRDIRREVPRIFQGKVDDEMLQWAIDNAAGALKRNDGNNTLAWVDFLAKSDRENAEIICEYVAQNSDWYGYNS